MISRRTLTALVYALAFLVTACAVSGGGYAVARLTADAFTIRLLGGFTGGCFLLLAIDALLLLGALGMHALEQEQAAGREPRESE